jgi:membrane protease YdiL (CAAX protease family)
VQVVRSAGTISQRVILGIILILIAPPAEELLFRGVLYPAIKQRGFPRLALWGSSLAFAAVHVNLATFLPLTLLALVLVWLYERTNNLLAAITTHSLFNALNFLLLQAQPWLEQKLKWLY